MERILKSSYFLSAMEKISALIDKLQELKNSNAGLQSISYYVQMLQAEILHVRNSEREQELPQSHIAVIMPTAPISAQPVAATSTHTNEQKLHTTTTNGGNTLVLPSQPAATRPVVAPAAAATPEKAPERETAANREQAVVANRPEPARSEKTEEAVAVARPEKTEDIATVARPEKTEDAVTVSRPEKTEEAVAVAVQQPREEKKPSPALITLFPQPEHPAAKAETKPEPVPAAHQRFVPEDKDNTPAPVSKAQPTDLKALTELNQRVAQQSTSLNDRLRQDSRGIGDRLGEMPVRDLRQAIGINDKFRFIQELFRGDVDAYERSVKTINEFKTQQEAEYWIERELKIRQGWDDEHSAVQQFYNLVRKRFS
jgi:hypothetical protein